MTEQPSDARLSREYDPEQQLREQQRQQELEERRVSEQPRDDDPGVDHDVAPPVIDEDDEGFDPTPPA